MTRKLALLFPFAALIVLPACEKTKEPLSFGNGANTQAPNAGNVQSGEIKAAASEPRAN